MIFSNGRVYKFQSMDAQLGISFSVISLHEISGAVAAGVTWDSCRLGLSVAKSVSTQPGCPDRVFIQ